MKVVVVVEDCVGSLVILSATATDSQVEQKLLLGFCIKFSVAARS